MSTVFSNNGYNLASLNESGTKIEILDLRESATQHIISCRNDGNALKNVRFTEDGCAVVYSENGQLAVQSLLNDEINEMFYGPVPGLGAKKSSKSRKNSTKQGSDFDFEVISKDDAKELIFGF